MKLRVFLKKARCESCVACYIEGVKRLLAILLLLALGLPGVAPLFALSMGDAQSKLPACCRRNGAHHCNTPVAFHSGSKTTVSSRPMHCPQYPSVAPSSQESSYALTSVSSFAASFAATSMAVSWANSAPRASFKMGRVARGPPDLSLQSCNSSHSVSPRRDQ